MTALAYKPCTERVHDARNHVLASATSSGVIRHWRGDGELLAETRRRTATILTLDYGCDGAQFATGGRGPCVRVYDDATRACVVALDHATTTRAARDASSSSTTGLRGVHALKFHPSNPNVLLAGGGNSVRLWDVRSGKVERSFFHATVRGEALDVDPTGSVLVCGSARKFSPLQLWSLGSGSRHASRAPSRPSPPRLRSPPPPACPTARACSATLAHVLRPPPDMRPPGTVSRRQGDLAIC